MNKVKLFKTLERLKIVKSKRIIMTYTFYGTGFQIQLVDSGAEVKVNGLTIADSAPVGSLDVAGLPLGNHVVQVLHG